MATTAQALPRIITVASIVASPTDPHLDQVRLSTTTLTTEQPLPCQTTKVDLWFAETPREQQQAKHLCGGCRIQRQCLAGALHRRESCGIWGGEIFYKGTIVAHQPTRGRPRIPLATTTTRCTNQTNEPVVDNARNQTVSPQSRPTSTSTNHLTNARSRNRPRAACAAPSARRGIRNKSAVISSPATANSAKAPTNLLKSPP
jgi:WhiB family redox-sensing transcriptional regulator